MGWTTRSDAAQSCADSAGAVDDAERIARLRHTRNSQPFTEVFRREELLEPKGGFSDACGDADGFSVVRASGLSDHDLRQKAIAYAAERPNRQSSGAIVAIAGDLRAIRKTGDDDSQVVHIYDDPTAAEPAHALIRVSPMPRPDFNDIKDKLASAFRYHIAP